MARIGTKEFDAQFSEEQRAEIKAWAGSLEAAREWAASLDERTRLNLGRATVWRDLRLIDQSDMNVVFYPTGQMSFGVLSEMIHAHATGKKVYIIYPFTAMSPFLDYAATRVWRPSTDGTTPQQPEEIQRFMARAAGEVEQELRREYG